jgi:hypothetical protein
MHDLTYTNLTTLQKLAVRHAHPVNLVLHLLSFLWGGYFLWTHHWLLALIFLAGLPLLGEVLSRNDETYLQTVRTELNLFHQLLIYHSKGISLILHMFAFATFVIGLWNHSAILIMIGISCSLVGHVLAWMNHAREEAQYSMAIGEDREQ